MVSERKLGQQMLRRERSAAKLGLRQALPVDKLKRQWAEPLTKTEYALLVFMKAHGEPMTAEDIAGCMAWELEDARGRILSLIDRGYLKVTSERGWAKYETRNKHELQPDINESEDDIAGPSGELRRSLRIARSYRPQVDSRAKRKALW